MPLVDSLQQGISLFNRQLFFEAHEALEDAWRASAGDDRLFLQGLTQAAVALHHHSVGNLVGAESVLARAIRNLAGYSGARHGIQVKELRDMLSESLTIIQSGHHLTTYPKMQVVNPT